MANFYNYAASSSTHGRFLQRVVSSISDGDHWFKELMAMMAQMLDGDGSQDAHFATITTRFGFPDTATAHAAYSAGFSARAVSAMTCMFSLSF